MLVALTTAKKLDWSGWILGIWTSTMSGGAGAVAGIIGPMVTDGKDFNLSSGFHHTLESMVIAFSITGLFSLAKFLQMHPAPDAVTINSPGPVTVNQAADGKVEVKS